MSDTPAPKFLGANTALPASPEEAELDDGDDDPFDEGSRGIVASADDAGSHASGSQTSKGKLVDDGGSQTSGLMVHSFSTGDDTTISAHTNAFNANQFVSKKIPPKKKERTSAWRQGSVRRNY